MKEDGRAEAERLFPALKAPAACEVTRQVLDADEEIFLLYTLYAPEKDRLGLGQVDSKHDVLTLTLDLADNSKGFEASSSSWEDISTESRGHRRCRSNAVPRCKDKPERKSSTTFDVQIRQSSTNLRTDTGDTGSIIWRSSLSLAEKLVRDVDSKASNEVLAMESPSFLISPDELLQCNVLELGSGTGVLPKILYSFIEDRKLSYELRWLATDQKDMLPLLRKNICGSKIFDAELDWIAASNIYTSTSHSVLTAFLKNLLKPFARSKDQEMTFPDLIVATDCIYNPSLAQAFVDSLNLCSIPLKTIAMVVCELRESEMMSEFLTAWLRKGSRGEKWIITALSGEDVVGRLAYGSIVWIAWRSS